MSRLTDIRARQQAARLPQVDHKVGDVPAPEASGNWLKL